MDLIKCQNKFGYKIDICRWKINQSKLLCDKIRNNYLYVDDVTESELKLLSDALDKKQDMSLLYWYVRLSFNDRHLLIDVVKRLSVDELSFIFCSFYASG